MSVPGLDWLVARPIAHRGLHDVSRGILENTASAFAAAIARNYAIECDLQITADGEAVVFHDESLERLTASEGWVKNLSAAEMRKLKLHGADDHVPSLVELLEQVNGKVALLIELKSHWDGSDKLALRALDALQSYHGPHCLMSFDPDVVEVVRRVSPLTVRGMVAERATDEYYDILPLHRRRELQSFSHMSRTQPHFISFYFRDLPFDPVTQLRGKGCPVVSWTIRSRDEAAEALHYSDQVTFEGFLP
jgi:glycerophosphoryl diester phosphodiesterase